MADLSRIHPKSVYAYDNLEGYVFEGRYIGMEQNKSSGTWRAVFQVDSDAGNDDLLDLFSVIRHWNSKSYGEIWRGFSGQEDYDHDYGWDLWIWSPKSCALHPYWAEQTASFQITDVQFFNFNESNYHDYEIGVNIRVRLWN